MSTVVSGSVMMLALRETVPALQGRSRHRPRRSAGRHTQWVSVDGDVVGRPSGAVRWHPERAGAPLILRSGAQGPAAHWSIPAPPTPHSRRSRSGRSARRGTRQHHPFPTAPPYAPGLIAHLCETLDARPVGPRIGYLTGAPAR